MIDIQFNPLVSLCEFIRSFGASLDIRLWNKLVEEETKELLDALRKKDKLNGLKEMADLVYVMAGASLVEPEDLNPLLSDEECQLFAMVIEEASNAFDAAQELWDFTPEVFAEAFRRVHASNMSKLGDDGKPIRREDGKILKGPNYREPDLSDLV